MIRIADLKQEDVGRKVVYTPQHGRDQESGKIKSWNQFYIFVDYGYNVKATQEERLEFIKETK